MITPHPVPRIRISNRPAGQKTSQIPSSFRATYRPRTRSHDLGFARQARSWHAAAVACRPGASLLSLLAGAKGRTRLLPCCGLAAIEGVTPIEQIEQAMLALASLFGSSWSPDNSWQCVRELRADDQVGS